MKRGVVACLASLAGSFASVPSARAQEALPYPQRTRPYSAAETTVRGDIRTVGMAGATTGLADTFIASVDNPSGLAMTDDEGDDTFTSDSVHDGAIQNYESSMTSNFVGFALSPYPWGFGMGFVSFYREGDSYVIPGAPITQGVPLDVVSRELQASLSRVFLNNRLSLGITLRGGQAEEDIDLGQNASTAAFHSYAAGATFGAMWQFPHRWLFGVSYVTPMRYSIDAASVPPTLLPGFFQPVYSPARISFGLGWIPNRFFRASTSLTQIGATPNTALLSNQGVAVGITPVWEPRLGAAYVFADYKELRGSLFGGTYLEFSRIAGQSARLHATGGVETKPWIFTVGLGIDAAKDYKDYLVSLSVDVFKVMGKLDLIPLPWRPPSAGFFHAPFKNSDQGLARPLVEDWTPHGRELDPIEIGLDIPEKIGKKVDQAQESIQAIVKAVTSPPEEVPGEDFPLSDHKLPKKKKPRKKKTYPAAPPPPDDRSGERAHH